jgi:hypothetical protein
MTQADRMYNVMHATHTGLSAFPRPLSSCRYRMECMNSQDLNSSRKRIAVSWSCRVTAAISQPSLVTAHKTLLRTALEDPRNSMFILVSEVCVPVHHPALFWSQLMAEAHVSRVTGKQEDVQRWWNGMEYGYLTQEKFLKSSQWVGLSRMHAMLVVEDMHVWPRFDRFCRTGVRSLVPSLCHYSMASGIYVN